MIKEHLGILDNHVQKIRDSGDAKSSNDILLETIKLLLENIDYSDAVLSDYGKNEIRKLFSGFRRVARSSCDFYQASKKHLDLGALNGEIGQTLERTTKDLADIIAAMEALERNEADLLEAEKELNEKAALHRDAREKISKLKEIYETVTDESLAALDREAAGLTGKIEKNKEEKAALDAKLNQCKTVLSELSDTFVRINTEREEIEENIVKKINEHYEKIQEIYESHAKDLNRIMKEIEDYKKNYADLGDLLHKAQEMHKIYGLHFGENGKIINQLKEYGIASVDQFLSDTNHLEDTVREGLKELDRRIKGVIVAQEEARKEIEMLQNK